MEGALIEMYLAGVSVRRVEDITKVAIGVSNDSSRQTVETVFAKNLDTIIRKLY